MTTHAIRTAQASSWSWVTIRWWKCSSSCSARNSGARSLRKPWRPARPKGFVNSRTAGPPPPPFFKSRAPQKKRRARAIRCFCRRTSCEKAISQMAQLDNFPITRQPACDICRARALLAGQHSRPESEYSAHCPMPKQRIVAGIKANPTCARAAASHPWPGTGSTLLGVSRPR